MTMILISINKRSVSDFSEINHEGLGPIVAQLDS